MAILKRLWKRWFAPRQAEVVTCYLVESGQFRHGGVLTFWGRQQAKEAAQSIRKKAGDHKVVVLGCHYAWIAYRQTANILAKELEAPTFGEQFYVTVFWALHHSFGRLNKKTRAVLRRLPSTGTERHIAMVIEGVLVYQLLNHYSGTPVEDNYQWGPPPGFVQELRLTYNPKTGRVIERRLIK